MTTSEPDILLTAAAVFLRARRRAVKWLAEQLDRHATTTYGRPSHAGQYPRASWDGTYTESLVPQRLRPKGSPPMRLLVFNNRDDGQHVLLVDVRLVTDYPYNDTLLRLPNPVPHSPTGDRVETPQTASTGVPAPPNNPSRQW